MLSQRALRLYFSLHRSPIIYTGLGGVYKRSEAMSGIAVSVAVACIIENRTWSNNVTRTMASSCPCPCIEIANRHTLCNWAQSHSPKRYHVSDTFSLCFVGAWPESYLAVVCRPGDTFYYYQSTGTVLLTVFTWCVVNRIGNNLIHSGPYYSLSMWHQST